MTTTKPNNFLRSQMAEKDIRRAICDYLRTTGWMVIWNLQGLGCYLGMPDVTAVKDGITCFIEFKAQGGKQTERQVQFQADVEGHGGIYLLINGIESGVAQIEAVLRGSG